MRQRHSIEDVEVRRQALLDVILQYKKKGQLLTRTEMIREMKKKGFSVDVATLYRDRCAINKMNTFVRDLTESNYSAYMEEIKETLDWIEEQALKQYKRKWTNSKKVQKEVLTKQGTEDLVEITVTGELAHAKVNFLRILKEVQELKHKLFHGDSIQISAALLKDKLRKAEEEIEKLRAELGAVKTAVRPR